MQPLLAQTFTPKDIHFNSSPLSLEAQQVDAFNEETNFLAPSEHPSDRFLNTLILNQEQSQLSVLPSGYLEDPHLHVRSIPLDQHFQALIDYFQKVVTEKISLETGNFSLSELFLTVYEEHLASHPLDSKFYIVGSFVRHLLQLCSKLILSRYNLPANENKKQRGAYSDIDVCIQLQNALVYSAEAIHAHLKNDFEKSTSTHQLKTPVDSAFPPQYYDICYSEEGKPDRSFDICIIPSHTRYSLSFVHALALQWDPKLQTFQLVSFENHLLQGLLDNEADNLRLLNLKHANFLTWWKVLHEITAQGARVKTDNEAFTHLRTLALNYRHVDKLIGQVTRTLTKFYEEHGQKNSHYAAALFTSFYFSSCLSDEVLQKIRFCFSQYLIAQNTSSLYAALQQWPENAPLSHFYQLLHFICCLRLCAPFEEASLTSVKQINHLRAHHLQIEELGFTFLLPFDLQSMFNILETFSEEQWLGYAPILELLLARLFPWSELSRLKTSRSELPYQSFQRGLTLGLKLIKSSALLHKVGLHILLILYANRKGVLDFRFIDQVADLLDAFSAQERSKGIELIFFLLQERDPETFLSLQWAITPLGKVKGKDAMKMGWALILQRSTLLRSHALRWFKSFSKDLYLDAFKTVCKQFYYRSPEFIWKEVLVQYLEKRLALHDVFTLYQSLCTHVRFQSRHALRTRETLAQEIAQFHLIEEYKCLKEEAIFDITQCLASKHLSLALKWWKTAVAGEAISITSQGYQHTENLLQEHCLNLWEQWRQQGLYTHLKKDLIKTTEMRLWHTLHYPKRYFELLNALVEHDADSTTGSTSFDYRSFIPFSRLLASNEKNQISRNHLGLTAALTQFYHQLKLDFSYLSTHQSLFVDLIQSYQTQSSRNCLLLDTLLIDQILELAFVDSSDHKRRKPKALDDPTQKSVFKLLKLRCASPSPLILQLVQHLPVSELLSCLTRLIHLNTLNAIEIISHIKILSQHPSEAALALIEQFFKKFSVYSLPSQTEDLADIYLDSLCPIDPQTLKLLIERALDTHNRALILKLYPFLKQRVDLISEEKKKHLKFQAIDLFIQESYFDKALHELLEDQTISQQHVDTLLKIKLKFSLEKFYQQLLKAEKLSVYLTFEPRLFFETAISDLQTLIIERHPFSPILAMALFSTSSTIKELILLTVPLCDILQESRFQKLTARSGLKDMFIEHFLQISEQLIETKHCQIWYQVVACEFIDLIWQQPVDYRNLFIKSLQTICSSSIDRSQSFNALLTLLSKLTLPTVQKQADYSVFFTPQLINAVTSALLQALQEPTLYGNQALGQMTIDFIRQQEAVAIPFKGCLVATFLTSGHIELALNMFVNTLNTRSVSSVALLENQALLLCHILEKGLEQEISLACLNQSFFKLKAYLPSVDATKLNPLLFSLFKKVYAQSARDALFLMHLTQRFDLELLKKAFSTQPLTAQMKETLIGFFDRACEQKLFEPEPQVYLQLSIQALTLFQSRADCSENQYMFRILEQFSQLTQKTELLASDVYIFFHKFIEFFEKHTSNLFNIDNQALEVITEKITESPLTESQRKALLAKKDLASVRLFAKSQNKTLDLGFAVFQGFSQRGWSVYDFEEGPSTLFNLIVDSLSLFSENKLEDNQVAFLLDCLNEQPLQYFYEILPLVSHVQSNEVRHAIFRGFSLFLKTFTLEHFSNESLLVAEAMNYFLADCLTSFYQFCQHLPVFESYIPLISKFFIFPANQQTALNQLEAIAASQFVQEHARVTKDISKTIETLESYFKTTAKGLTFKQTCIDLVLKVLLKQRDFESSPLSVLEPAMRLIYAGESFSLLSSDQCLAPWLSYSKAIKASLEPKIQADPDALFALKLSKEFILSVEASQDVKEMPTIEALQCTPSAIFLLQTLLNSLLQAPPLIDKHQIQLLSCVHYCFYLLQTNCRKEHFEPLFTLYLKLRFTHLASSHPVLMAYHEKMLAYFPRTPLFQKHLKAHLSSFNKSSNEKISLEPFLFRVYRTCTQAYPWDKNGIESEKEIKAILDFIQSHTVLQNTSKDFNLLQFSIILRRFFLRKDKKQLEISSDFTFECFNRALNFVRKDPFQLVILHHPNQCEEKVTLMEICAMTSLFLIDEGYWFIPESYLNVLEDLFKTISDQRSLIIDLFANYLFLITQRCVQSNVLFYNIGLKRLGKLVEEYLPSCENPAEILTSQDVINMLKEGFKRQYAGKSQLEIDQTKQFLEQKIEQELKRRQQNNA